MKANSQRSELAKMNRQRSRSARRRGIERTTRVTRATRTHSEPNLDSSFENISPERQPDIPANPIIIMQQGHDVNMAAPQVARAPCYINFTSRATLHKHMQWYEVGQLMETLKNIWKINFSITEQRQQALLQLNNLDDACPYDVHVRFPEGRLYVCTGTGDWLRKFQQLRTSLSLKEHKHDKKTTGEVPDISDAMVAFHNSITNIMTQIGQQENVFYRDNFERIYSLIWQ
ncbi:MAG: coat protein [Guiyang benyvirus 1]|nr:MAG: coat protein [Guiyang benyvirus 1]